MPVEHPPVTPLPAGQPRHGVLQPDVADMADPPGRDGVHEPGGSVRDVMRRRGPMSTRTTMLQRRDQGRRRPVVVDDHPADRNWASSAT